MDPQIYQELIELEESHWWFRSRRAISQSLLKRINLPASATILEAGCGSGGNLALLSRLGNVSAFELNDDVRTHAKTRGIGQVEAGKLPGSIPFDGKTFDLITLFDVLEHTEEDEATLRALARRLNPGGAIFLTVPAFQWLFCPHDTLHHHHRRYSRAQLERVIASAGLRVEFISYWNFFLFPVAVIVRLASGLGLIKSQPGAKMPSPLINRLLTTIVASERHLIPCVKLPFGLSLVAIIKKA